MTDKYFSDRERGPAPRIKVEITSAAWDGIIALIDGQVTNGGFGADFPEQCPDGRGTTGTDHTAMRLATRGEIPEIQWPLDANNVPPSLAVLDFLEFCYEHVAEAVPYSYHSFSVTTTCGLTVTRGGWSFVAGLIESSPATNSRMNLAMMEE